MAKFQLNPIQLGKFILSAIEQAETLYEGYVKAGEDKKAYAVTLVNEKVNIPFIGEKTEAAIIGVIIDIIVDLVLNANR